MIVQSAVLGPVEVGDNDIYNMPDGMPGFEDCKTFAVVKLTEDDVTLTWFQCTSSTAPCFDVFNPFEIITGYEPKLSHSDLSFFGCKDETELEFLVIAVVPENFQETTVNLKSPIVLCKKNKTARQVILSENDYPIKFYLTENSQQ